MLAEKLGLSPEELRRIVDNILNNQYRPDNTDLEEQFGEDKLGLGISADSPVNANKINTDK